MVQLYNRARVVCPDHMKKSVQGQIYLAMGAVALLLGLSSTAEAMCDPDGIPAWILPCLISAYALSGVTFFFGIESFVR